MGTRGDDWLSIADVCKILGVGNRTLYRMIDQELVPAYKMGRVLRLRREEVDAFIANSAVKRGDLRHLYPDTSRGL